MIEIEKETMKLKRKGTSPQKEFGIKTEIFSIFLQKNPIFFKTEVNIFNPYYKIKKIFYKTGAKIN